VATISHKTAFFQTRDGYGWPESRFVDRVVGDYRNYWRFSEESERMKVILAGERRKAGRAVPVGKGTLALFGFPGGR